jgi:phosphatidylinositol glycan class B
MTATDLTIGAAAPARMPLHRIALLLCCLGLFVRLGAFYLTPDPLFPDEEFQYLEQAHRLVFGTGLVPWEYLVGIRSWLLPGMLAPFFAVSRLVGEDPRIALWSVAALLSLLSLPSILCAVLWGNSAAGRVGAIAAGMLNATWFEIAYFAPHALADSIAASLLIPGLFLLGVGHKNVPGRELLLGGALLGLTIAVRLQLAPVVCLVIVLAVFRGKAKWRGPGKWVLIGAAVPILLAGALDAVTLTYPFQSFWLYLWVNVGLGAAAAFGTSPWYVFFLFKLAYWWIAAIPLAVAMLIGGRKEPVLLACAAAIVIPFMVLSHKEDRFIFPALPILMTLAGIGSAMIVARFAGSDRRSELWRGLACGGFWFAMSIMTAIYVPYWHFYYEWPGLSAAERIVNADPHACGFAVSPEQPWARMPGYTRFRPGIPLYGFSPGDPPERARAFDYAIDFRIGGADLKAVGFEIVECWGRKLPPGVPTAADRHFCLWRRTTPCMPSASATLVPAIPDLLPAALSGKRTAPADWTVQGVSASKVSRQ